MNLIYPACFYPFSKGNGYTVVVPDLPGCVTEWSSLEEAIQMGIDVACGWILTSIEDGEELPKPSNLKNIELEYDNGFVNYLVLNIDEYAKSYGNTSIKKTLSIPNWLNTLAEKQNINFSQVLQTALKQKLGIE